MSDDWNNSIDDSHPLIRYDRRKCSGCGRCVQFAKNIQGCYALELKSFNGQKKLIPGGGRWLDSECTACGGCVRVCPTGAILDIYHENISDEFSLCQTHCVFCGLMCPITMKIANGKIIDILSRREEIPDRTMDDSVAELQTLICTRGRYYYNSLSHNTDQLSCMIREKGQYRPVSNSELVKASADKIKRFPDNEIGLIISPFHTAEEILSAGFFARDVLRTNRLYFVPGVATSSQYSAVELIGHEQLASVLENPETVELLNLSASEPWISPVLGSIIRQLRKSGVKYSCCDQFGRLDDTEIILQEMLVKRKKEFNASASIRQMIIIINAHFLCEHETLFAIMKELSGLGIKFIFDSELVNFLGVGHLLSSSIPELKIGDGGDLTRDIESGKLNGLYVVGVDIVRDLAGISDIINDWRHLKMVVLHEHFNSVNKRYADFLFPVKGWYETAGTVFDHRGQKKKIMQTLQNDGLLSNTQIFSSIAEYLNINFNSDVSEFLNRPILNQSDSKKSISAGASASKAFHETQTPLGWSGTIKVILSPVVYQGRPIEYFMMSPVGQLQNFDGIHVNPSDGIQLDVADGELAAVSSDFGRIQCRILWDTRIPRGWARLSNGFPKTLGNILWHREAKLSESVTVVIAPAIAGDDHWFSEDQRTCLEFHR